MLQLRAGALQVVNQGFLGVTGLVSDPVAFSSCPKGVLRFLALNM